jgi:hypothetical protein
MAETRRSVGQTGNRPDVVLARQDISDLIRQGHEGLTESGRRGCLSLLAQFGRYLGQDRHGGRVRCGIRSRLLSFHGAQHQL